MIALPFLPAEKVEKWFNHLQQQATTEALKTFSHHTSNLERAHGSHQNQQWLKTVAQRPQQTSERKSLVASLSTNSAPTRGSSTCLPLNQTRVQQKAEKTSTYVLAKVSEDCTLSSVVLMVSLLQPLNSAVLPMGSSTLCNSHEIAWRHQKFKMAPCCRVILGW